MGQYTYLIGMLVTSIIAPLLGVWIYKRRIGVDMQAKEEDIILRARQAALEAQQAPMAILKEVLAKRENELALVRAEDRTERGQFIETLTAIKSTMQEIAIDLKSHREEESTRSGAFHKRLDIVDDRLLVMETRLQAKPA